jgi:hypothetical protein
LLILRNISHFSKTFNTISSLVFYYYFLKNKIGQMVQFGHFIHYRKSLWLEKSSGAREHFEYFIVEMGKFALFNSSSVFFGISDPIKNYPKT